MVPIARPTDLGYRSRAFRLAGILWTAGGHAILTVLRWQELARQRRTLLSMDDRMLKDIGISRADAHQEGSRRFWDERGIDWMRWR